MTVCSEAFMRQRFAKLAQARAGMSDAVLLFSDQIPCWLKVTPGRQLYSRHELPKKGKREKVSYHDALLALMGQTLMSQKVVPQEDEEVPEEAEEPKNKAEGQEEGKVGQMRGKGSAEQDKFRVTIEACQAVYGYFKEGEVPVGVIMRSSLVLAGAHGRLSNISDEGTFIADELFYANGKEVRRVAGSSARGLLGAWVRMRRESEKVRSMLQVIEVYQQPSGFVDSVIMSWITERAAVEVPVALHQRDLFAGALSQSGKEASFLAHQVQAWIGGKMTCVLQLTDTDVSYPLKAGARAEQRRLKENMRGEAMGRGEVSTFRCGPLEVLRVAHAAHMKTVELNAEKDIVLSGLRRNGLLSYRPCLSQGCLRRADEEEWARRRPEGSHRYPRKWLNERYCWTDETGVPLEPDWKGCGKEVSVMEEMADVTPSGVEGCKVSLAIWKDMPGLEDGVEEPYISIEADEEELSAALKVELVAKARQEAVQAAVSRLAGFAGGSGVSEKQKEEARMRKKRKAYRMRRRLERQAVRKSLRSFRKVAKEHLKTYSRQQVLASLRPGRETVRKSKKHQVCTEGLTKKSSKDPGNFCLGPANYFL